MNLLLRYSACFLLSILLLGIAAHAREKKNVLYLNSYHHGYQWSDELLRGVRATLDASPFKVDLQIEYIDAKKYNYQYINSRLLTLYREKFKDERFDIVIISDNDALNFIQSYREQLIPGIPVVFSGINGIETVDLSAGNITGVVERYDLIQTLEVARRLHPEKNKMVFVGDQSTAGRAIEKQAYAMLEEYDRDFEVTFWSQLSLEETKNRVEALPDDTFLFFSPWYQTVQGKFYTAEEVMQAIYDHSSVPIYTAWGFLLGHGTVGGHMLSGYQHGQAAARMAVRVLKGQNIETIPVELEASGQYMFDYKVMERLQINQKLLPENAVIINSPKAFYELPKELFWTIIVSFLLLLVALIFLGFTMIGRRKVERKVLEQLSFQETLMDTIPQLVSWKDITGRYLGANRTFIEFFGIENIESVVNRTTRDVVDDTGYIEWSITADHAVVNQGKSIRKVRRKIKDYSGNHGWLEVNKVPFRDQSGRIVGILSTAENVTKEQNLEHQLLQSQKMEAIGTLAGGIAHDFNNILTSIINSTELAIGDVSPGTQTDKDLQRVLKAARRGSRVVKQILSFSRPSKEGFRTTDMVHVVQEVLSLMDVSMPSSILVHKDIPAGEILVDADPTQVHQALLNLCTNAFHALRENGGILKVRLEEIELGGDTAAGLNIPSGRYAAITVSDSGPGIKPELLGKIFDPFFTTKDITEGTGLGLAVVHGIVKAHQGGMEVKSEPGQGSTFTIFLPTSVGLQKPAADDEVRLSHAGISILFIEDDEDQLNSTPRILKEMGHRVVAMGDPVAALARLEYNPDQFDLIITDYDMPQVSGVELAISLPDIPVILVSGREDAALAAASASNIVQILVKPYDKESIGAAISAVGIGE